MILCCGEALIDMLPRRNDGGETVFLPVPGGAVFNVAIALGRLGADAGFFSGLSDDVFGQQLQAALAASNVDSSLCVISPNPTTLAFVVLKDGDASFTFYDENSAGRMLSADQLPHLGANTDTMYFGAISLIAEPCGSAYEALMVREASKRLICLDPNIRPGFISNAKAHRARIKRMIALSDIVKVSNEDMAWLYPDTDPEMVIKQWLSGKTSLAVLTRGENGAEAFFSDSNVKVNPVKTEVIDTVGAGDSFNAGLLAGLDRQGLLNRQSIANLTRTDLLPALKLATKTAAFTVSRPGAVSPWLDEIETG